MIFVDSNIPMYAAGAASPQKRECLELLRQIQDGRCDAVSSAEVLQEILHRYRAIGRLTDGVRAYESFRALPIKFLEITAEDVDAAKDWLLSEPRISSRDALHLAVMQRAGVKKIATYDRGFLGITGITVMHLG